MILGISIDIEKAAPPTSTPRGGKYTRREWTGERWKYYYNDDTSGAWGSADAAGWSDDLNVGNTLEEWDATAKQGVPEGQNYEEALSKAMDEPGSVHPVSNPGFGEETLTVQAIVSRKTGKTRVVLRDSEGTLIGSNKPNFRGFDSEGAYQAFMLATANTITRYDDDGKPLLALIPNVGKPNAEGKLVQGKSKFKTWTLIEHPSRVEGKNKPKTIGHATTLEAARDRIDKQYAGTGENVDFPSEPMSKFHEGDSGTTQDIETGKYQYRTAVDENGKPKRELDVTDDEKKKMVADLARDYWPMLESEARQQFKNNTTFFGDSADDRAQTMEKLIGDHVPGKEERDQYGKPSFAALDPESPGYKAIEHALDTYHPDKGPLAGWMSVQIKGGIKDGAEAMKLRVQKEGTAGSVAGEGGETTQRADLTADSNTSDPSNFDYDGWRQHANESINRILDSKAGELSGVSRQERERKQQMLRTAMDDMAKLPMADRLRWAKVIDDHIRGTFGKSLIEDAINRWNYEDFLWKAVSLLSKDKNIDPSHQYLGTEGDDTMQRYYYQDPTGNYVRYTNAPTGHPDEQNFYGEASLHPSEPTMEAAPEYFTPDGMKLTRCPECDAAEVEWNERYNRYDPQNLWAGRWRADDGLYRYTYIDSDLRNMPKVRINQQNALTDVRIPDLRQGYTQMFNTSDRIKDQVTALCLALLDQGRFRAIELCTLHPQDVQMEGPLVSLGGRRIYADFKVQSALQTLLNQKQPDEPLFSIPLQKRDGKLEPGLYRRIGPHYLARVLDLQGVSLIGLQTYHSTICFSREVQRALENYDVSWETAKSHALLATALEWGHDLQMEPDVARVMQLVEQVLVDPIVIEVLRQNAEAQDVIGHDTQVLPAAMPAIPNVSMDLADRTPEESEFSSWVHAVPVHEFAGEPEETGAGGQ